MRRAAPAAPRWQSSELETDAGTIESRQRIGLEGPIVETDEHGARELGRLYLDEVARVTHGIVRASHRQDGVELVLGGLVPLLRFGPAEPRVGATSVECGYAIRGGLLAARPGGSLVVTQLLDDEPALELAVAGYFPRLGGSAHRYSLRRLLYGTIQARVHRAVSRRFFERAAGAP